MISILIYYILFRLAPECQTKPNKMRNTQVVVNFIKPEFGNRDRKRNYLDHLPYF